MTPYKNGTSDDYWRCSWGCPFKDKSPRRVVAHENKKHRAITRRPYSNKKEIKE